MMKLPTTSSASVIQGKLSYSKAVVEQSALSGYVENWVKKQKFWPQGLKQKLLKCSFQLIYVPYVVVSGYGSATWSSDVGSNETRRKDCSACGGSGSVTTYMTTYVTDGNNNLIPQNIPQSTNCSSCNGRGYFENIVTHWRHESGTVKVSYQGAAFLNTSNNFQLECGERRFPKEQPLLPPHDRKDIQIITPYAAQDHDINALGLTKIQEAVQSRLNNTRQSFDAVRNWQQSRANVQEMRATSYLYPAYFSVFSHKDRNYQVQIDGVTGFVYAEKPNAVKYRKAAFLSIAISISILLIAIIIYFVFVMF